MLLLKRLAMVLGLVPVVVASAVAGLVAPYVIDDQKLDTITMAVALDWRDFGLDKAKERLQYELDHDNVGLEVGDDACSFDESSDGKVVRCNWSVDVGVPFTKKSVPLSFASRATIAPDGDLR